MNNGTLHYLTEGDLLTKDGKIIYPPWKTACSGNMKPIESRNIFRDFLKKSLEVAKYNKDEVYNGYVGNNPIVKVSLQKNIRTRVMCGSYNGTR
jgi:hypothetical protein